ncbi:MAG: LPS export ABC transporter periplasmic protein LptC [Gammaproteobacteria bacterium]|nr:LPS export ABC transporter periplasmic protein LptC [Rhodocyclaceae bacterium]MBU3909457.1 LPS export ABC transporter periplasmic protein LptC [Gammaproteobacteria bacterium]MBU3988283.1 LPS export ABC transporter periplasmic protein LptC [Gammaproteobacteria bacterium]MBU4003635.1 LPS export ABC transporter periplasmic protein LptC [Gammaproteobacteria bacterium]MBU4021993.1 LPS export ABC transporter periplasmic protein LptC [Gammaproteobacteria bacterium]
MPSRFNPTATLFPLIIVGLLAGMTFWLEQAARPLAITDDGKSRHDPDYIIENFEVRRFDPEGALQHTLRAEIMRHYPDDDSTVIGSPHLTFHRQPPTLITAREARLDGEGKHVQLIDDVRVRRNGLGGNPDSVLTTARLDAFPDDELATSDVPVTIEQGRSNISGGGLSADNKTSIYVLEGPVYGIFHRATGRTSAATQLPAAEKPESKPKPKPKPKPKSKPESNR